MQKKIFRKALIWNGKKNVKVVDKLFPKISENEAILKVETCCLCGSDLRTYMHGNKRVSKGSILGHEISGKIIKVGKKVKKFSKGDNISIGADIPCGKCKFCLNGDVNKCKINLAIGYQLEGGFTNYMKLNNLVLKNGPIAKTGKFNDFDKIALAEPLACCINGFEKCNVTNINTVTIFGAGAIGQLLGKLYFYFGAKKIILIDKNQKRLNIAKKIKSANFFVNSNIDIKRKIMKITKQEGSDLIFTACSDIKTHKKAFEIISKGGTINFFGGLPINADPIKIYSNNIHYNELHITGSHGSTPAQHLKALKLIINKKINLNGIITHKFDLNDSVKAFKVALKGEALKIAIKPNEII